MKPLQLKDLDNIPKLKLAVVGHVEWMRFLEVDQLPKAGTISHAKDYFDTPAGGGVLTAIEMQALTNKPVHFFTALGNDSTGKNCYQKLKELGLIVNAAWRDLPTRRGISFVDSNGERAITVIGERLQPESTDNLPWEELNKFDGIFITAADSKTIQLTRQAKFLAATPRVGIKTLNKANIRLDLLVGSHLDPGEKYNPKEMTLLPKIRISTKGSLGCEACPGGAFEAVKLKSKPVDTYGCGDKFAAGVTTGLSANWGLKEAISLGAHCGAKGATYFGPY